MSDGRVLFCRGGEDEADHDDIWDDTELIAAYDRALASARTELGMAGGLTEQKPNKKWRIGDFCRAVYAEDMLTYEAEILSVGGARCRLRYVGYGNEEDQPLARLQPSAGKKARRKQEKEAEMEGQVGEEVEVDAEEYEEADGQEVENEEGGHEEDEHEEDEEVPVVEKATQRASRKSRKSATQQGDGSTQNFTAAGQSYESSSQQPGQAGQYPAQNYPAWGPWGAGSEHSGPATGPWGPHFGPWGPKPGPLGPPHGLWGAAPPSGPWGPHQGPATTGGSFHPHSQLPPPPPPPPIPGDADPMQLANMLMSWYISGYHTGYYQASREAAGATKTGRK